MKLLRLLETGTYRRGGIEQKEMGFRPVLAHHDLDRQTLARRRGPSPRTLFRKTQKLRIDS